MLSELIELCTAEIIDEYALTPVESDDNIFKNKEVEI